MNIHVGASLEAEAELRYISNAKNFIISPQSSKPNFCIVQDSLLSAFRMTYGIQPIAKEDFFSISMRTGLSSQEVLNKMQHIRRIFKKKGKKVQCFHGKGLISLILPSDFEYERNNKAHPEEPVVKIHRGVLYEGTLDKSCLGTTANSILHRLYKEYGIEKTATFIDEIQFITNNWLVLSGFTIGLGDCLTLPERREMIDDVVKKCYIEAEGIKTTTSNKAIREVRIIGALSKARDIGMKIAKDALSEDNNLKCAVQSGSKGDHFNISQLHGLLGQQDIIGKRVQPTISNSKRTLPHYPFENLSTEQEYESRGFIASSFIKGLNPREFYFHMMNGRISTIDTSLNTSTSGYMMRSLVKLTEDIKTQYDGTVRDNSVSVYQYMYGENGYDPRETLKIDNKQQACDIGNIALKLNLEYEKKGTKVPL